MKYRHENTILKIIKFTPPLFIISITFFITLFLYYDYKYTLVEEKKTIEKEFMAHSKEHVKENVDVIYNTLKMMQSKTEESLKKSIKQRVYEAYAIMNKIYNENKHKDKKTIEKLIKDALVDIRFNDNRGYYYINSMDYKSVLFPLDRKLEGSDIYNFKDGEGKYLIREIVNKLKKEKEGFTTWYFYKPSDTVHNYKKIGFNKYFEPLDWYIGTGEYVDDFKDSVKKDALGYVQMLKYNDVGYLFVLDKNGTYLNHLNPDLIGINLKKAELLEKTDEVFSKLKKLFNKDSGEFISYIQKKKPDTQQPTLKTSYIRALKDWD